jgi:hypothetical protein
MEFVIATDASDQGLASDTIVKNILYSRTLQPNVIKKWAVHEKEALAVLWAFEQFRAHILGSKFIVETDHESLQWLRKAKSPAQLVRWAIRHNKRHESLSKSCTMENYLFVLDKTPDAYFDMVVEQAHDISVRNQIVLLQNPAHHAHQHYKFEHEVLYRYVIVPGITNRLELPVLPQHLKECCRIIISILDT